VLWSSFLKEIVENCYNFFPQCLVELTAIFADFYVQALELQSMVSGTEVLKIGTKDLPAHLDSHLKQSLEDDLPVFNLLWL
jgi:hypothetical protein